MLCEEGVEMGVVQGFGREGVKAEKGDCVLVREQREYTIADRQRK